MKPGKKYNPATETSRRPTPEKFEHLRKWIDVDEKFLDITNITELKNINVQLEQSSKLFVSNVISRVIAQLLGAYGDGFVTLEATSGGRLKVELEDTSPTVLQAKIDFHTAEAFEIVTAVTDKKIKITNLMLTVAGETNLTFQSDANELSGDMDFGGTDEPRGMVHNFGDHPLETVAGEAFKIKSSIGVQVSGYVTYYTE
ncbi:hypothetical protein ES702_06545 [subsurface metagenome]